MQSSQLRSIPQPLPDGVNAEATARGILVTIKGQKVSLLNKSTWKTGLLTAILIFIVFSIFFGSVGARKMIPGVLVLAGIAGLMQALRAQIELSRRRSQPAKLELTGDKLIIEEPGFEYRNTFFGKRVNVRIGHVEYALADLTGFSLRTFLGGSLTVQMYNGANIDHLNQRRFDQLQWTCNWLSAELRARPRMAALATPKTVDSFVYDSHGPHER